MEISDAIPAGSGSTGRRSGQHKNDKESIVEQGMADELYADIAFPTAVRREFTYRVKKEHQQAIRAGMRVWTPLRERTAIGMVVRLHRSHPSFKTRYIGQLLDERPVMSDELLLLSEWVQRFYYASWGETIQAALPVGLNFVAEATLYATEKGRERLKTDRPHDQGSEIIAAITGAGDQGVPLSEARRRWGEAGSKLIDRLVRGGELQMKEEPKIRVQPRKTTVWYWNGQDAGHRISELLEQHPPGQRPKWVEALATVQQTGLPALQEDLLKQEPVTRYTLDRIAREGLAEPRKVDAREARPQLEYAPQKIKQLNEEQQPVCDAITGSLDQGRFHNYLIYGVTGSGKTEVYIHALRHAISKGRGGLILVPEIALTPQTVRRFYQIFGDQIAVLHSRLNDRERLDAWQALLSGEKRIAIGARSAVFAPVRNLGLIIIDEEHDPSYKQENPSPRYHARETAIMRAYLNGAVMVMGSATPSMVSLHSASRGKAELLRLRGRHADVQMPEVKVIDLKEYRSAMRGSLAVALYQYIEQALERREQVILLYNRRGYASFVQCQSCGEIPECRYCSVTLTYHKRKGQLRCHYCGYTALMKPICGACGMREVEQMGAGSQKIEEELGELFPEARVLRMDQDTTRGKNAHADMLARFAAHEADILVGTQMVAKGLDFPNVTVVGVVNSDTELAFPSYRSGERMFQLLSQVAGRSGRGEKKGVVGLQTYKPDHPAIQHARSHDYEGFSRQEMGFRKELSYPPFSRLLKVFFRSRDEQKVGSCADAFAGCLQQASPRTPVLGPAPSSVVRVKNEFIWECHLKLDPGLGAQAIQQLLDDAFERYESQKPDGHSQVRITVNVDALE